MNGRNPQPPGKGKSNETADDISALNGIEIKREPDVKLEDAIEIVTVPAASGSIVNSIRNDQTDGTYDVSELSEIKSCVKKEKIDKEAKTNSSEASAKGGIGSTPQNSVKNFRSKRKQPKPKQSSGGRKKAKKNMTKSRNKNNKGIRSNKNKSTVLKAKGKQQKCSSCDYTTANNSHFNQHIRMHSSEKPFPCIHCTKRFTQKSHLQSHMRSHVSEFLFSCSNCLKEFFHEAEKLEHEISCKIKRYNCDLCKEYSTLRKSNLIAHMRVHTGERPFQCDQCDYTTTQKGHLKQHTRMHSGEKPFSCTHCAKRFRQKIHLRSHLRTHVGEFLFSCPNCLEGFSKEDEKLEHEICCKIRRYECFLCEEYSTFYKTRLEYHFRMRHTGESI